MSEEFYIRSSDRDYDKIRRMMNFDRFIRETRAAVDTAYGVVSTDKETVVIESTPLTSQEHNRFPKGRY